MDARSGKERPCIERPLSLFCRVLDDLRVYWYVSAFIRGLGMTSPPGASRGRWKEHSNRAANAANTGNISEALS